MSDAANWPAWLHAARLFTTFAVAVGLGVHAYYRHKLETVEAISARRWMYWLYSAAFFFVAVADFSQLCVAALFSNYQYASFHLGYVTLVLTLSYLAVLGGVRAKS